MEEQICKEITDMPGEFLVNPICQCPEEMSCPSVGPKNVDVMVTDKKVTVFNVKCQNSESREHRYSKMMTYGQMLMIPPRQRFNF